jgi:hypothetical protein
MYTNYATLAQHVPDFDTRYEPAQEYRLTLDELKVGEHILTGRVTVMACEALNDEGYLITEIVDMSELCLLVEPVNGVDEIPLHMLSVPFTEQQIIEALNTLDLNKYLS